MKVFNLMNEQLQIDFDNIIKTSSFTKRDIELKQNSLNEFIKTGFPNRRQENWKFSDLNQIINNRYYTSKASLEDINTLNQINKIKLKYGINLKFNLKRVIDIIRIM